MPRQYVRGGPWKNSEDEILKAAVMKYGLNQWSRVASLLNRKSAKQCKIRWYEWLDPNIKKTEWTREEEEKLLHLAKIMPTQWRTIAPIVGRTASQCLEHYERLLDEAQAREEGTSTTGEASSSSDDPRKPRVGEIDPNPETKPARPDPIHMDEDELEMLNEARARLANTKGKKQKRKAREKQLEQARRLAALQKRRELKAAGIQIAPPKQTKKKKPKNLASSVDYNKEIPFHIKPAPGFYDTTEEDLEAAKLSEVGNSMAIIEELQKHEEEERRKKEKEKISVLGDNNAPNKNVEKLIQANDNNSSKVFSNRKIKLVLPPPMITDEELETISKISKRFNNQNDLYKGSEVTKQLLGSSSNERTPFIQPTATPLKGDTTIERVRELQQVLNTPTPLQVSKMKDFEKNQEITKGSLSTFNSGLFGTPSTTVKTTPLVTPSPFRDQLHINGPTQDEVEVEFHKQRLREGFSKLPTPSGDKYAVLKKINPEDRTEYKDKSVDMEDAGEEESKRFEIENNERLQKQLLRSSAVKRQLPRPNDIIIDISALKETVNTKDINDNNEKLRIQIASEMIAREIQTMIASDAVNNPYKLLDEDGMLLDNNNSKKNNLEIPFNQWIRARVLLAQECSKYELPSFEEFNQIYDECLEKFTLEQVKEITKDAMKRLEEKTFEVSKQLEPVTSKYNLLLEHVKKVREEIYQAEIELDSYQKLEKLERNALPSRLTSLREEVEYVLQKEKDLQLQYKELIDEKEKLKIIHLPQEASDEMVIE